MAVALFTKGELLADSVPEPRVLVLGTFHTLNQRVSSVDLHRKHLFSLCFTKIKGYIKAAPPAPTTFPPLWWDTAACWLVRKLFAFYCLFFPSSNAFPTTPSPSPTLHLRQHVRCHEMCWLGPSRSSAVGKYLWASPEIAFQGLTSEMVWVLLRERVQQ